MRDGDRFSGNNSLVKEAMYAACSPSRLIPNMSKDILSLVVEILEFGAVAQRRWQKCEFRRLSRRFPPFKMVVDRNWYLPSKAGNALDGVH